jgi:hypothetical protein
VTTAHNVNAGKTHYAVSVLLGAIGGGLAVALVTNAIPKMMSRMMSGMIAQMAQDGCEPTDM